MQVILFVGAMASAASCIAGRYYFYQQLKSVHLPAAISGFTNMPEIKNPLLYSLVAGFCLVKAY